MIVGYARVSSTGQSLDVQLDKLAGAGVEKVFQEKLSGKSASDRPQLQAMLEYVREGDTAIITKLDRLARSLADLLDIVKTLEAKGVSLKVLDQSIDTGSAQGRLMLSMLGAFAEFELELRRERQMDGIAKAKQNGTYKGRPKGIDDSAIRKTIEQGGLSLKEIADLHGVSKTTVHRITKSMQG